MGILRDRLRQAVPELANALEHSWSVAFDGWLAAMSPQADSFNAYPHLRNHENHLERIWKSYTSYHGSAAAPLLSAVEIYVLLSAILFHDIGRTRTGTGHGKVSDAIVRQHYAALGIPSHAFAATIGRISRSHDSPPDRLRNEILRLTTTAIDPFGEVRERECAALLILIDYMDATFTRVVPPFLKPLDEMAVVGAFRSVIQDVEVDLEGNLVKTILGDHFEEPHDMGSRLGSSTWQYEPDLRRLSTDDLAAFIRGSRRHHTVRRALTRSLTSKAPTAEPLLRALRALPIARNVEWEEAFFAKAPTGGPDTLFRAVTKEHSSLRVKLLARQYAKAAPPKARRKAISPRSANANRPSVRMLQSTCKRIPGKVIALLGSEASETRRILSSAIRHRSPSYLSGLPPSVSDEVDRRYRHILQLAQEPPPWPQDILLAIILGNCRESAVALRSIREILWSMGLPVKAWLVERKEHLYNDLGNETHEPAFSKEDLIWMVDCMWRLTTHIPPGGSIFSYEALAAEANEPDVGKTRRIVERLRIVASPPASLPRRRLDSLLVSSSEWQWEASSPSSATNLKGTLQGLSQPDQEYKP